MFVAGGWDHEGQHGKGVGEGSETERLGLQGRYGRFRNWSQNYFNLEIKILYFITKSHFKWEHNNLKEPRQG